MLLHLMKTSFVIMLAVVFSASQLCACMAVMDAAPVSQHEHQSSAMAMDQHDAHQDAHQGEDGEHDMHGGEAGCSHCAAPSLEAAALVAKITATLSHPDIEKFAPISLSFTDDGNKGLFPLIARGHGWLDPPPTSPVIQKIRLLI